MWHRYVCEFKLTHRAIKNSDDTFVYLGFPIESLSKYLPDVQLQLDEDEHQLIELSPGTLPEVGAEQWQTDFGHWKQSVPLTEAAKKQKLQRLRQDEETEAFGTGLHCMSGVLKEILAFPLERKSPLECMQFLMEIKQHIVKLI